MSRPVPCGARVGYAGAVSSVIARTATALAPLWRRRVKLLVGLTAVAACVSAAVRSEAVDPPTCLAAAAREQVGVTVRYDPAYRRIPYPAGDVPSDRGVCTDVLVRAYRRLGLDLQVLVHEDMVRAWAAYPKQWGAARPDTNIDHRRVPNLVAFFARHGEALPVPRASADYRPGDIVTWRLPSGVPHIGILSDRRSAAGSPLVIHNIGRGVREDDVLFTFPVTGRYRYLPESVLAVCEGRR